MKFCQLTLKDNSMQEQDKTFMIPDCYLEEIEKILIKNNIAYEKGVSLTQNKSLVTDVKKMSSHLQSKMETYRDLEWWRGTEVEKILNKKLSLPLEREEEITIQIYCDLCTAMNIPYDRFKIGERFGYKIKVLDGEKNKVVKLRIPYSAANQYLKAYHKKETKLYQYNHAASELQTFMRRQRKKQNSVENEDVKIKSEENKIDNYDKPYLDLE